MVEDATLTTEYMTEQEQIELLKRWLKQYALVIIAGVALAAIVISGWRWWQQRQTNILNHASAVYDEMLTMRAQNNVEATRIQAKKLFSHYSQTIYGQMAAFMLAREAIQQKDYPAAETQLHWVIDHSHIAAMRQIARVRLARVQLAETKPEESLKTLSKIEDKSFDGLTNEVKGDAYLAMKDIAKAREAYQAALSTLPNADTTRPLLLMKFDNLASAS